MRTRVAWLILAVVGAPWTVPAGESAPAPKPPAVTDDEKKKLLDAETPEQKKLRGELVELAKSGGGSGSSTTSTSRISWAAR
jgi:hypothetical protein